MPSEAVDLDYEAFLTQQADVYEDQFASDPPTSDHGFSSAFVMNSVIFFASSAGFTFMFL